MATTSTALQAGVGAVLIVAGVLLIETGVGAPLIMAGGSVVPDGLRRTLRAASRAPAKGACP